MRRVHAPFILLIILIGFGSCGTSKKAEISQEEMRQRAESPVDKVITLECDHSAVVLLSEDPDCGVLFRLPNQLTIVPATMPETELTFQNEDKVRITYNILEDVSTLCKEAFGVAEISCIAKDLNIKSGKSDDCKDVIDVFSVSWMQQVLTSMDARKVTKFDYALGPVYAFENSRAKVYLDCKGNELCRLQPGEKQRCEEFLSQLSNEYVILVVNN